MIIKRPFSPEILIPAGSTKLYMTNDHQQASILTKNTFTIAITTVTIALTTSKVACNRDHYHHHHHHLTLSSYSSPPPPPSSSPSYSVIILFITTIIITGCLRCEDSDYRSDHLCVHPHHSGVHRRKVPFIHHHSEPCHS